MARAAYGSSPTPAELMTDVALDDGGAQAATALAMLTDTPPITATHALLARHLAAQFEGGRCRLGRVRN